ncbi:hypothetical protein QTP88_022470 [Uroleucon formosanum]
MEGSSGWLCEGSKKNETNQPTIKKNSTESSFETAELGDDDDLEPSSDNPIEEDRPSASNNEGIFKTSPNH